MLPRAEDKWTWEEAAHLLNRAGFGGNPQQIDALHAMGRFKAVESLLQPAEALDAFPAPEWTTPEKMEVAARTRFEAYREVRRAATDMSVLDADKKRRAVAQQYQQIERRQTIEAQSWWVTRMRDTQAPLREKMCLFWHDHFATSVQKVKEAALLFKQNQLFRQHALGNFKQLAKKITRDCAMLLYLDVQNSQKGKPNENFAREVMELFTLGQGNYTEKDISEAARAFTGYTVNRIKGTVEHNSRRWDETNKTFLGKTGKFNADDIIDVIFEQKQAARYAATKLWEFFAYEEPPTAAIDELEKTFREAQFEVTPLLRDIFLSREFYSEKCMGNQIKCPVVFLIQMLKQLEIDRIPPGYSLYVQNQLGQVLFAPPNVAGWDWGKAWINTNTLLTRYQIAGNICKGGAGMTMGKNADKVKGFAAGGRGMQIGTAAPDYDALVPRDSRDNIEAMVAALTKRLFSRPLSAKVTERFVAYAKEKQGVIFTNQEVGELIHLMMSTPHYQLT